MGKIIPILKVVKKNPLSPLMISTLRAACKMQNDKKPIGQSDLDGSFIALVKRGLIEANTTTVKGKTQISWVVTKEGVESLNKLGFNEPC